ncbi:MAG: amino acid adenylation domain-containing protein, partial [Betaproteobacteria bacterium]|nr:amino acid adenylation domain-containing protein [Betaproteobacteria bacterium]
MSANAAQPDSLPAPPDALDDAERRRVLHDFARQSAPAPDFVALPERIAQQALRCPDAVALRFRGRELSYRDLDLLARRWAAVLRRHGAGPETAVAMCLPRCFAEVVGLLAILYSGAAFVPLDPEHPEQRLRDMLEDVRPRAVLTTPATRDKLRRAAGPTTPVLALRDDGGGDGDEQHGVQPMPGPLEPTREQQLAYILFTSGSTGRPKGVQIEHRGLSNHVAWVLATLRATSGDVFLQSGSAAFDGSLWSFFAPLCCGARMVLAAPEEQADPRLLEALMRAEQVSIAKFVPSTLRLLLEHARPGSGHALRQLACGGEVLDATLAARVFRTFPDACLHNFYGPTEASVVSTAMQVTPRDLEQATLSIGRPVPGMRAYVLDEAMRPLPVGAVGELFVAGIGLARGYLGRPELDAQRFVELAWLPGERLYRTGDLVRWLADGRLGFLGRGDDQVKLRGLRIELGEIEAALLALPGVRQAAALVLGSTPQEQQLTGFVAGPARDTRELRAWREQLAQRLPLYMLPSRFVFVDAFETLASGKIDRRALAAQHAAIDADASGLHGLPESRAPRQGPRSALESELLDIWRAVLGRDDIVPEHDFFDLGGHSLHATRMVSQVRATLGIGLALREVFDKPTLRELAAEVERRLGAGEAGQALPPIHAVERTGVLPLSFSQRRMWLEHQMDPRGAAYNVYSALRLRGELDREALQHALDALCARHEAFRTRIVFEHGEPHAVLDPVRPATLRLLQPGESTATGLVAACAAEPFDLERGPLHRFALACLGEREHVLLLVMHHIVTDDWSRGIVLADLERLYGLARRGEDVALPPRPIDFVDFASWQRAHVDEASQQAQLHYWTQRLDGAPAPALPGDTARSRRDDNRGGHVALPLPRDWIDAVQRESVRLEATPFMLLLAVFQSMLARWCAQDDMCVAFPIANRTRVEAEGVVGSLVNTLLMRNQVDPARGFRDFLQEEVRPAVLGAFAHQDLPFDHLVKHLRRHGSARPGDVRVLFNVLNTPRQPLRFEGLQADYVELDLGTTQFDLSLGIDLASRKVLSLSYASQLFQRATIEALGHLFLLGVERAVRRPDAPLHTLWVAAPDELERIARWNAPPQAPAGSAEQTLPALLAGSRASHGAAVRDAQGATLSHAELWQRVGRLAESLRLHGIGRGFLVGLGLPRGADMLAAQLAVWQCGAAYVPLDPDYPQARLRDMIDDARLSLLLGTRAQRADWSAYGVPLLEAEAAASEARAAASAPPPEAP